MPAHGGTHAQELKVFFAIGIIILVLNTLIGIVYLGMRKGRLPAHGSKAALAMYALMLGYLIGGGCVFASIMLLAIRWLP
nr:hypothetical protein [uncultured Comamonas sp.]